MSKLAVLLLLAGFGPNALAATRVTVEQVEQLLSASHSLSDAKVAAKISDLQLTGPRHSSMMFHSPNITSFTAMCGCCLEWSGGESRSLQAPELQPARDAALSPGLKAIHWLLDSGASTHVVGAPPQLPAEKYRIESSLLAILAPAFAATLPASGPWSRDRTLQPR